MLISLCFDCCIYVAYMLDELLLQFTNKSLFTLTLNKMFNMQGCSQGF